MLSVKNLSAGYTSKTDVVRNISFECDAHETIAVIGKNGCGKSTLLKAIARQLKPSCGSISIDGKDIKEFVPKHLAQKIAVLPQVRNVPSITAKALVMHGRFPYLSFPRIPTSRDKEIVMQCMKDTDTLSFANIDVATLSGGQRQRVYIAMLLAQQTDILLLDEPTTFLDINCQYEITDLISSLRNKGKCVIAVLHDISQAMQIADKILLLDEGNNVFFGSPEELISSDVLEKYMNIVPHKIVIDGNATYCFSRSQK